jgi:hypothetical protein
MRFRELYKQCLAKLEALAQMGFAEEAAELKLAEMRVPLLTDFTHMASQMGCFPSATVRLYHFGDEPLFPDSTAESADAKASTTPLKPMGGCG